MSCPLILKADWLEYSNGSAILSKIVYVALALAGIALFAFELNIESKLNATCSNSDSLKLMLRILQIIAILLIVLPIIFFFLDYASTGLSFVPPWMVNAGIGFTAIISLIVVILIAAIQIEIGKKCPGAFPVQIWIPGALVALASFAITIYRWRSTSSIKIPKHNVNWQQVSQNARLIESIGKKQARQCGIKLEQGASVASLQFYLKQRQQEFNNSTNAFSRLFKRPDQLPKDKIPNIIKMYTRFEDDFNSQSAFSFKPKRAQRDTQTQQFDANEIDDTNETPNETDEPNETQTNGGVISMGANAINYGLSSVGNYIGSYFK